MSPFHEPRVLYIAPGNYPDYQSDCLFHGLKTLLGDKVVDVFSPWYMYRPTERNRANFKSLYGKGFTLYGLIEDSGAVDRTDIQAKIRARHFDLVIYGSIHRCQKFLFDVLEHYPEDRVCFIDGEDSADLYRYAVGRGRYFKRELPEPWMLGGAQGRLRPIGFAMPKDKIVATVPKKQRIVAHIDPRDRKTYIYDNEADYYRGYQESCFGITTKKAGWDCLRHYEILANGCFPVFLDLAQFPVSVMTHYPKHQMLWALEYLTDRGKHEDLVPNDEYLHHLNAAMDVLRTRCTTEAIARHVLASCAEAD